MLCVISWCINSELLEHSVLVSLCTCNVVVFNLLQIPECVAAEPWRPLQDRASNGPQSMAVEVC